MVFCQVSTTDCDIWYSAWIRRRDSATRVGLCESQESVI